MTKAIHPRLIRPERDGKVGEWSYLFKAGGEEYIFPALVNELGKLTSLITSEKEDETPPEETDPLWATKVIYWKASEWEEKFLPLAVDWIRQHGFTMPDVPYNVMEFRKIEDRDGDERVSEVINVVSLRGFDEWRDTISVHQFREVAGEEGAGQKPLMQWWGEGYIDFRDGEVATRGSWSIPNAGERLADWGRFPVVLKDLIEKRGASHALKVISLLTEKDDDVRDEELRAVTIWIAFCLYINSMKVTYVEGEPGIRRARSAPKTLEEAVALEQATVLKSAGILRSGRRRRQVLNPGSGTKHRYRYLVRGHERVINGKSIWVKPQIRGNGEFMVLPTATTSEVQAVIPATPVTVNVPAETVTPATQPVAIQALPPPRQLLLPAPRPNPRRERPLDRLVAAVSRFFSRLLRA